MKQKDLQNLYREFNRYFGYKMPKCDIKITGAKNYIASAVQWDDNGRYSIHFGKSTMLNAMAWKPKLITWESILLHEMVHIWEYEFSKNTVINMGHSGRFYDKLKSVETLSGIPQWWDFKEDW